MKEHDPDLRILHHTLGISDPSEPGREPYRNHYVASEGHENMSGLERLEARGLMRRYRHRLTGDAWVFSATDAGRDIALATRPRLSKAKLRYSRYLALTDVVPDLTFHDFLTNPELADYR